jgi:hypothetical protein
MMELARNLTTTPKDLLSFELYGECVMLIAASVICALQQERFVFATNIGRRLQMVRAIDLPDQNHASAQFNYALCLEDGQGVVKDKKAAAADITNWLPIRMMQTSNTVTLCVLQRGEVFRRMNLKVYNVTNLLSIKIMHGLSSIMLCALGMGEAL